MSCSCASGSATSATPSACSSCISCLRFVLLTISSASHAIIIAPPCRSATDSPASRTSCASLAQAVLERARRAGASGCDCDVSRGLRPDGHGAQGQARHRRAQPRPLDRRLGLPRRAAEGAPRARQHLGFLARRARADGRRGARHRAPHRRGRLRRPARRRACWRATCPTSICSIPGRIDTEEAIELAKRCEAAAFARVEEDPQLRGRHGLGAALAVRARQQPGLRRRLPRLAPLPVVLGHRRGQGPDAARRLVQRLARARRSSPSRARSAATPAERAAGAPRRAQDRHLPGAGAVRGAGGDRPDRPFRLRR